MVSLHCAIRLCSTLAEAVTYFNKLNPLLNEFLSLRESIYRASQEFEAACWASANR